MSDLDRIADAAEADILERSAERDESPGGMGINGTIPGTGTCVMRDCGVRCGPNLMCRTHWHQAPAAIRREVYGALRRWNDGTADLADLRDAQWAAVEAVMP